MKFLLLCAALLAAVVARAAELTDIRVRDAAEFRAALAGAKPGTRLLLAGGAYGGGFQRTNLRGEPGRPVVIAAADPQNPPVFSNAKTGLQLSNPAHLELHGLVFEKLSDNGLNIDDGGSFAEGDAGAHHVVLRGLIARDVGTTGNQDGIKLSGLRDFRVEGCTIERWGTGGGSAIDLVGCHRGVVIDCVIRHREPEPPNCTGVQSKGGTSDIAILRNRFEHAGGRAVNIGGSTGRPFFRPPLAGGAAPGTYARSAGDPRRGQYVCRRRGDDGLRRRRRCGRALQHDRAAWPLGAAHFAGESRARFHRLPQRDFFRQRDHLRFRRVGFRRRQCRPGHRARDVFVCAQLVVVPRPTRPQSPDAADAGDRRCLRPRSR